jgi:hypothetical protein
MTEEPGSSLIVHTQNALSHPYWVREGVRGPGFRDVKGSDIRLLREKTWTKH